MKEKGYTIHGLETIPPPYKKWVAQRNGTIAEVIKTMMPDDTHLTIATRPVHFDEQPVGLFYGTKVSDHGHVDKGILHPSSDSSKDSFAHRLEMRGLVLPGVSVSSKDDVLAGYKKLGKRGTKVRVKQVDGSDGQGQYEVASKRGATKLAEELHNVLETTGMIVESQIKDPKTISVGFAVVGGDQYSFIARQKDEKVVAYDDALGKKISRNRYMGADVTVVRGGITSLRSLDNLTEEENKAIDTSGIFYDLFKEEYGIDTSRISFDYMYGHTHKKYGRKGDMQGGITDITARPGGTDPALILAARELHRNDSLTAVDASVRLDYTNKKQVPENATVFVDDPALHIYAYITSRTGAVLQQEEVA